MIEWNSFLYEIEKNNPHTKGKLFVWHTQNALGVVVLLFFSWTSWRNGGCVNSEWLERRHVHMMVWAVCVCVVEVESSASAGS